MKILEVMRKQKKYMVLGIISLLVVVIGVSYAVFTLTSQNTNNQVITAGSLIVEFDGSNQISGDFLPLSNTDGMNQSPYTFTVVNNGTLAATYYIDINNTVGVTNQINHDQIYISVNGGTPVLLSTITNPIVGETKLEVAEEDEYEIRVWLKEDAATTEVGKNISLTLDVYSEVWEEPCQSCGTLKVGEANPGGTSTFLNSPVAVTRAKIESINFIDTKEVPGGVVGSWDVSEASDGTVMAWYTDTNANTMYEVTIGQEGGVKGNADSSYLFSDINNLKTINLEHFNTSEVTNMESMFDYTGNNSLTFTLDVSNLDTSNVTNMSHMFNRTGEISSEITLDVSNFDTSNVTNMESMFSGIGSVNSRFTLDVSNFDTSKVTNMAFMFVDVASYNPTFTLDLSSFNTSQVTNMESMFSYTGYSDPNFTINMKNAVFNNVTNYGNMFGGSKSTDTFYAKDANAVTFITTAGFIGTVTNCSTTSCP